MENSPVSNTFKVSQSVFQFTAVFRMLGLSALAGGWRSSSMILAIDTLCEEGKEEMVWLNVASNARDLANKLVITDEGSERGTGNCWNEGAGTGLTANVRTLLRS